MKILLKANSVLTTLKAASATALSYGQPFLLKDLSILNAFNNWSIALFLNSLPLSVCKILISLSDLWILEKALVTRKADFFYQ